MKFVHLWTCSPDLTFVSFCSKAQYESSLQRDLKVGKIDDPDRSFSGIKNQQMVKTTHGQESEVPNSMGLYTYPVEGIPVIKGGMTIPNLRELIDPGADLVDTKNLGWRISLLAANDGTVVADDPFLPDVLFGRCFSVSDPYTPVGKCWQMDIYTKWWVFFFYPELKHKKLPYSSPHPFLKKKTKERSTSRLPNKPTNPPEKIHGQVNL